MVVLCKDIHPCGVLESEVEKRLDEICSILWDLIRTLPDTVNVDLPTLDLIESELAELRADVKHLIEKVGVKEQRILAYVRMATRGGEEGEKAL